MPDKTNEQFVREFADAVQEQDRFISEGKGNARSGNRAAKKYIAAGKELLGRGFNGIEAFTTLLSHADASVRVMAAAYLLEARTELAVAALKPIAAGRGLAALGAQMTLQRYAEGNLRIED